MSGTIGLLCYTFLLLLLRCFVVYFIYFFLSPKLHSLAACLPVCQRHYVIGIWNIIVASLSGGERFIFRMGFARGTTSAKGVYRPIHDIELASHTHTMCFSLLYLLLLDGSLSPWGFQIHTNVSLSIIRIIINTHTHKLQINNLYYLVLNGMSGLRILLVTVAIHTGFVYLMM